MKAAIFSDWMCFASSILPASALSIAWTACHLETSPGRLLNVISPARLASVHTDLCAQITVLNVLCPKGMFSWSITSCWNRFGSALQVAELFLTCNSSASYGKVRHWGIRFHVNGKELTAGFRTLTLLPLLQMISVCLPESICSVGTSEKSNASQATLETVNKLYSDLSSSCQPCLERAHYWSSGVPTIKSYSYFSGSMHQNWLELQVVRSICSCII